MKPINVHQRPQAALVSAAPPCACHNKVTRRLLLPTITGLFPYLSSAADSVAKPTNKKQNAPDLTTVPTSELPPQVPLVRITKKLQISKVIKGCRQLDGSHGGDARTDHTKGTQVLRDFEKFIKAGVTSMDVSDQWGASQAVLGQFLRVSPHRRPNMQVINHLTFRGDEMRSMSRRSVQWKLDNAMHRMNVNFIDLVILEWQDFKVTGWRDAALFLGDLQERGRIGGVGLGGWATEQTLGVRDAGVPLAAVMVPWSLVDRRPALQLQRYCRREKVPMIATSPLAGGLLGGSYNDTPKSSAVLETPAKVRAAKLVRCAGGWDWFQEQCEALQRVAERRGVGCGAVALAWSLAQDGVVAAAVGARNNLHLKEICSGAALLLSEEDLLELDAAYESADQPLNDVGVWERGTVQHW